MIDELVDRILCLIQNKFEIKKYKKNGQLSMPGIGFSSDDTVDEFFRACFSRFSEKEVQPLISKVGIGV